MSKKPQLTGGNHLAIYRRGRRFELGTTENKSREWPEQDSNPGPPDGEPDAPTTRPRCLVKRSRRCVPTVENGRAFKPLLFVNNFI